MESSKASVAAIIFVVIIVGVNFFMYGIVRGLMRREKAENLVPSYEVFRNSNTSFFSRRRVLVVLFSLFQFFHPLAQFFNLVILFLSGWIRNRAIRSSGWHSRYSWF